MPRDKIVRKAMSIRFTKACGLVNKNLHYNIVGSNNSARCCVQAYDADEILGFISPAPEKYRTSHIRQWSKKLQDLELDVQKASRRSAPRYITDLIGNCRSSTWQFFVWCQYLSTSRTRWRQWGFATLITLGYWYPNPVRSWFKR